ncbi:MAG: hypothetical protein QM426_03970 [Euryarchaeota archaeon]|nr:hypothetical protein [Euryarchaeota archaeon]
MNKRNREQEALFLIYKKDILQAEVRRVLSTIIEELDTILARPHDEITFANRKK